MILNASFVFQFSGTSSDDSSSCDESMRFRRTRAGRIGIRMGTLREHTMYTSALSCSDHDYPSSSEQSCDTVIYVGPNGHMLSDRELTDNEGPPPPTMFRPSPLPCRRGYGGSKSSGDEGVGSADGRSTLSDGDGYVRKSTAPKCGASVLYSRFARNNGAAEGGGTLERTKLRTKVHMSPKHRGADVNAPEQWVDGPAASGATYVSCAEAGASARAVNVRKSPQRVEQWVDGPNAVRDAEYSLQSAPVEQWIDGPSTQTQVVQANRSTAELWVDGPRAFRLDRGQADGSTPDPPCEQSNLSTNALDVGSATSLAVEPDSRPVSMQGVDATCHHVSDMPNLCGGEAQNDGEGTSSFVRDWLDKHGAVASSDASRSPHHRSSRRGIERGKSSRQHPSLDEMLFGETNRKCEKSPASERRKPAHGHKTVPSRPDASPAPSRHSETSHASRHLSSKCVVPSGGSNRTAAWVESVQQSISTMKSSVNGSGFEMTPEYCTSRIAAVVPRTGDSCSGTADSSVQCKRLGDECVNGASSTFTSTVDAVSNLQLATEAVTMADEGTQCVSLEVTEEPHICVTDLSTGRSEIDHALAPVAEESMTSVSDCCDLNRQSIYEFQIDDRLESSQCDESLSHIAQEDVDSFHRQLLDVCNDDVTKTAASVTLAMPSEKDVLSRDCFDKNNDSCLLSACYDTVSPIPSEEAKNLTNRRPVPPSCLRRPDGASNPNLSTTDPVKPSSHSTEYILQSPVQILSASKSPVSHSGETTMNYALINRSVEGQCCQDPTNLNSTNTSDLPPKSPGKPSTPRRLNRPSVLPKPDPRCAAGNPREKPQVPTRTSSMQKSSCCFNAEPRTKPATPTPNVKLQKECLLPTDCAPSSKSPTSRLPSLSNFIPVKSGHHSSRSSTSPKHPGNSCSTPASKTPSSSSKSPSKTNNHKSASPSRTSHVTKLSRFMGMRSSVEDAHKSRSSIEPSQKKDRLNKQLLSPYSVISKARSLSFSGASSGHGSGSSSGKGSGSYQVMRNSRGKAEGTSSGYESMRRDSEVTGTSSSPHDSTTSESSSGGRRVTKTQKKKMTCELILNFTFICSLVYLA